MGLLGARPTIRAGGRLVEIHGRVPDLHDLPAGCRFEPRCFLAKEICKELAPDLRRVDREHKSRCHFAELLEEEAG
ncbi:MAG: oligopeptide/dipeptide ABC transporter ATP-binding protein [Gaiellaceae bacterium]